MGHRDHGGERGAVRTGLGVSSLLFFGELAAGWWTNSLALMGDAAHVFADVAALTLALFALRIGSRPASPSKTWGYYRAEILAALVNGVVLWVVVVFIGLEAVARLREPAPVAGAGMGIAAALGLAGNAFVAVRLRPHKAESLNVRGAYLHVLSDLLGSVGALAAAVVVLWTGWSGADAVAGLVIAGLILVSSWALVREAVDVLMEAVPPHVDLDMLQRELEGCGGVDEIHDLHVWTLTTGHYALSAHAVVDGTVPDSEILDAMAALCARRFHVEHVTIQIEHENRRAAEPRH